MSSESADGRRRRSAWPFAIYGADVLVFAAMVWIIASVAGVIL